MFNNFRMSRKRIIIPRQGLIAYFGRPNSDNRQWVEGDAWNEETSWWGYELSALLFNAIPALGNGVFFDAVGTPKTALATEIAAMPGINTGLILFKLLDANQQTGKLAIYATGTSNNILAKAKKGLKIT